ncbi:MAG: hypothetical protein GY768_03575 [Planctomycetaceae bacterium]|nr:hypothetical protein [Planctomycetaceae bacterium]
MNDPNSVVDFLRTRGLDSSQRARRELWQTYAPLEPYLFSADQNLRLLDWLRFGESMPQIELIRGTQIYDVGEPLQVRLSGSGSAQLHTGFSGEQALELLPHQTFSVGELPCAGLYPVIIQQGDQTSESLIISTPSDGGRFEVGIWEGSQRYDVVPSPVPAEADDPNLLERFFAAATELTIQSALATAGQQFLQPESLFGVGLDIFVGVTGTVVFPPAGGSVFVTSIAGVAKSFALDFLYALIDEVSLPDSDKARLRLILTMGNILRIGRQLKKIGRSQNMCDKFSHLESAAGFTINTFKLEPLDSTTRMAGSMVFDSVTKSVSWFCDIQSAEVQRRNRLRRRQRDTPENA